MRSTATARSVVLVASGFVRCISCIVARVGYSNPVIPGAQRAANTMDAITQQLMQRASQKNPVEYEALLRYLVARKAMPEIKAGVGKLTDARGQNQEARFTPDRGAGKVELSEATGYDVGALLHELTHAAQTQAARQVVKQPDMPAKRRSDIMSLLDPTALADTLAPVFTDAQKGYRTSMPELAAWATTRHTGEQSVQDNWPAPNHLDATLMQELQIMLDLATRSTAGPKGSLK